MGKPFSFHEISHKIEYAHRVIRELLRDLPATEQFRPLREAGLDFKMAAEHRLVVTPSQILEEAAKQKQEG